MLIVSGAFVRLHSMPVNMWLYANNAVQVQEECVTLKVWMHLLQELGSRCEHSTKNEKMCSKTSLFTHSKSMRHRGGKAQTAVFPQYILAELLSLPPHK